MKKAKQAKEVVINLEIVNRNTTQRITDTKHNLLQHIMYEASSHAVYSSAYPSLPDLQSQADDTPAPAIAPGDPLNDDHFVAAKLQHTKRKHLHETGLATTVAEVIASKKRKTQVLVEISNQQPVGPDAIANNLNNLIGTVRNLVNTVTTDNAAINARITDLVDTVNTNHDRVTADNAAINARITNLVHTVNTNHADLMTTVNRTNVRIDIESARNVNRSTVRTGDHEITAVSDTNGDFPLDAVSGFHRTSLT